jgi:GntR family transcriptional regulator/MocR family aminotransferase
VLTALQDNGSPAYRQVYEALRGAILAGRLAPGTMLPSSRVVADQLGLARGTVVQAYEMLTDEGYLEGVSGSGTYVAQILPEEFIHPRSAQADDQDDWPSCGLSRRGVWMLSVKARALDDGQPSRKAFDTLAWAVEMFPLDLWATTSIRRHRARDRAWLQFGEVAGYRPLREALVEYLGATRSVTCSADQVVIFSGLVSAANFIAQVLVDPNGPVWVENPCMAHFFSSFLAAGADITTVPVDEEGFDLQAAIAACPEAALAFVTPSCQFPLGMTMSMSRRLALLEWARETGAWIIEDDYNGEFRYRGRPLPSLQGLDRHGRVFYLGTFSKTLFPSIRLAYVVVPPTLVEPFVAAREMFDLHPPVFEQMVVADFISEGHFQRHIRRARKRYAERQAALIEAASQELTGLLEIVPRDSGKQLVGWLPEGVDEDVAVEAAAEHGVTVNPLGMYYQQEQPGRRPGLVLGYAAFEPEEIQTGVGRLATALRSVSPKLAERHPVVD